MHTLTPSAECFSLVINLTGGVRESIRKQRKTLEIWLRLKMKIQRKEIVKKAMISNSITYVKLNNNF